MTLYSLDITTDANTAEASKKLTQMKVNDGVIHKIDIVFPPGCAGLVKMQMLDGGHQFVSSTEGQYLSGDSETINIPEFYEIEGGTRNITIKTWNLDDTYPHTIQVRIYILPKNVLLPVGAYEGIIASMKALFVDRFKLDLEQKNV